MLDIPSRWIPLEANPEVLKSWSEQVGLVTASATFHDVYGLDPELLEMIPDPVKAVVFLFPISLSTEATRLEEDAIIESGGQPEVDPSVLFVKQTVQLGHAFRDMTKITQQVHSQISNACGTIGLLHALTNSNVTIAPESSLAKFIEQAIPRTPLERAELLEKTELFASIHSSAAQSGQSGIPQNLDTDLHFCAFVQAPSPVDGMLRLLELDGRRAGPVDRGPSGDLLKDVAKFIRENYMNKSGSMRFSMIALAPPVL